MLAFARLRELLGFSERSFSLVEGTNVGALWNELVAAAPDARALRAATRIARNGTLVDDEATLAAGDEVALLPPVSGG